MFEKLKEVFGKSETHDVPLTPQGDEAAQLRNQMKAAFGGQSAPSWRNSGRPSSSSGQARPASGRISTPETLSTGRTSNSNASSILAMPVSDRHSAGSISGASAGTRRSPSIKVAVEPEDAATILAQQLHTRPVSRASDRSTAAAAYSAAAYAAYSANAPITPNGSAPKSSSRDGRPPSRGAWDDSQSGGRPDSRGGRDRVSAPGQSTHTPITNVCVAQAGLGSRPGTSQPIRVVTRL